LNAATQCIFYPVPFPLNKLFNMDYTTLILSKPYDYFLKNFLSVYNKKSDTLKNVPSDSHFNRIKIYEPKFLTSEKLTSLRLRRFYSKIQ